MAVKVGGTEVITNARQLSNIASVDSATVTALGVAGIGGGGGIELTTSEAVVEGDTLAFNFTTGKVEKILRTGGYGYTNLGSLQSHMTGRIAHISGDVFAVSYEDSSSNTHKITLAKWNSSSNTFTSGTPYSFSQRSGNPSQSAIVLYSSATNKVIWITFYSLSGQYRLQIMAFTPNTTNLTLTGVGSEEVDNNISATGWNTLSGTLDSTGTKAFVLYKGTSNNSLGAKGIGRVISIGASGTSTLTVGSATGPNGSNYFASGDFDTHNVTSDGSQIIATYWRNGAYRAVSGTLSGTSVSWGSDVQIGNVYHTYYSHGNLFKHTSGLFGVVVHNSANAASIIRFSVSSSNVISGATQSSTGIQVSGSWAIFSSYDSTSNTLYFGSRENTTTKFGSIKLNTSVPTQSTIDSVNVLSNSTSVLSASYNPSAGMCFYGLENSNLFGYYAPQVDNYFYFVGCAKEAASANTTVKIANAGQIATGLSGLTAGHGYRIIYTGGWQSQANYQTDKSILNGSQRAGISGIALTTTTMLMINDFMYN